MTKPKDLRRKTLQPCFFLGKAMYVPHIYRPNAWVTYGGQAKTLKELKILGAKIKYEYLFEQNPLNEWISGAKV